MAVHDPQQENGADAEQETPETEQAVPIGIARIRQEWRAAGLADTRAPEEPQEAEPVVFSEVDGGAGVGDYTLDASSVRNRLALSQDAIDRIVMSGELDSVLVRGPDGEPRRLFSESSVARFEADSAIDPEAIKRAARDMADSTLVQAVDELRQAIDELKNTQGKVLQQMKDMLLLEVRNLKEQDRDLTSFVYELADEIRNASGRRRR